MYKRQGLVYYAACSADVLAPGGQFVIEASMAPERLDECVSETLRLLARHAQTVDAVDLERARHQIQVRRLRALERPSRQLEDAALDLFALGRVRGVAERAARLAAISAEEVRAAFQRMHSAGVSVSVAGQVGRGVRERLRGLVASHTV